MPDPIYTVYYTLHTTKFTSLTCTQEMQRAQQTWSQQSKLLW